MSMLITAEILGDTEKFRTSLTERAQDYELIAANAKVAGALHHRFGIGSGSILIVDEWTDETSFRAFFGQQELQEFIGKVGGDTSVPPHITVTEAITSPDQF